MNDPIYINDDLQLTGFQPNDQENMVLYLNDTELYRNTLTIPSPYLPQDAEQKLAKNYEEFNQYGMLANWAIRHRTDGLIGSIGAFMKKGQEGHRDELGYWLAAPYRGQGIMSAVLRAFVAWQFAHRPTLVRLEALVFAHNPTSAHVLEKSGFQREGYLRKCDWKDGQSLDTIILSYIRE
ncbi:MAG: GNAT family N-acetyltransferase [Saprospiraceae bacterium]